MLRYVVALCLLALSWAQDCQVANIQVMQNFDKTRVSWKIYLSLSSYLYLLRRIIFRGYLVRDILEYYFCLDFV